MQTGPTEVTGSGIKIDGEAASTVPGLYACGDSADHNRCVHGAITGGYRAGKSAAREAAAQTHHNPPPTPQIREMAERFMAPLHRPNGHPYRQIGDAIRKIMAEHVGPMRTETGLKAGLAKLERLENALDEIVVNNLHDLMRAHETRSVLNVGKVMAGAALFRTESRNKPYHHRLDYPETDNENWCGLVVARKVGGSVACTFEPIQSSH